MGILALPRWMPEDVQCHASEETGVYGMGNCSICYTLELAARKGPLAFNNIVSGDTTAKRTG